MATTAPQKIPAFINGRPETGPMQFGEDWPGVFIRGDNAMAFSLAVNKAAQIISKKHVLNTQELLVTSQLKWLAELLSSCRAA